MNPLTLLASVLWNKVMQPTAYVTGLSAAISRGDAAVALLCFDRLVEEAPKSASLDYILTSVMLEQCWYLVGEWESVIKTPDAYRDFVLLMAQSPTNKDASALFKLAMEGVPESETHKELVLARKIGVAQPDVGIALFERTAAKGFKRLLTGYEMASFTFLLEKAKTADFLTMKWLILMACILVVVRGLQEDRDSYYEVGQEAAVKLPYWAQWFGTKKGELALQLFSEESKLDIPTIKWCWYVLETEFVPPGKSIFPKEGTTEFTCFESVWWNLYINDRLDDALIETWMKGRKRLKKLIETVM